MNILITGASSKIGRAYVDKLIELLGARSDKSVVHLASRVPRETPPVASVEARWLELDLLWSADRIRGALTGLRIDCCVHLAAVTHTPDERAYFDANLEGTAKIAKAVWDLGCRCFVFVSSQTAALGAGAYAESKFRAEQKLLEWDWQSLSIVRPSELVLSGGKEGLDKFFELAKRTRLMPVLIDWPSLFFSPMDVGVFVDFLAKETLQTAPVIKLQLVRGPRLSSFEIWRRSSRALFSLPVLVPVPLLALAARFLGFLGRKTLLPEQIQRLRGARSQSPRGDLRLHEVELPFELARELGQSPLFLPAP